MRKEAGKAQGKVQKDKKIKDLPEKRLTAEQERKVKGGGYTGTGGSGTGTSFRYGKGGA